MQNIILITRENAQRVSHVSVFLCARYVEASFFCRFVNRLSLSDGEKLNAKRILMGKEYELEKNVPVSFEDMLKVNDRMIQKILKEIDVVTLARALSGCSEEVQEKFFCNMSKRASAMLKEDMEYAGVIEQKEADTAKSLILEMYISFQAVEAEACLEQAFAAFSEGQNTGDTGAAKEPRCGRVMNGEDEEETHIVLVFWGAGEIADKVCVVLCSSEENALRCCEFINRLKPGDGTYIYARLAEQMVEYETEKPLLTRFDQILSCDDQILGRALAKTGYKTIIPAIKGLDPYSTEKILMNIPEWMQEKLQEELAHIKELSKESKAPFNNMKEVKWAREQIVNAVISVSRKVKKQQSLDSCFLKD